MTALNKAQQEAIQTCAGVKKGQAKTRDTASCIRRIKNLLRHVSLPSFPECRGVAGAIVQNVNHGERVVGIKRSKHAGIKGREMSTFTVERIRISGKRLGRDG